LHRQQRKRGGRAGSDGGLGDLTGDRGDRNGNSGGRLVERAWYDSRDARHSTMNPISVNSAGGNVTVTANSTGGSG
jgi:hypothetical protein